MHPEIARLLDSTTAHAKHGEWGATFRICDDAYQLSLRAGDADGLLEILTRLCDYYRQAGENELAVEHAELTLHVAAQYDSKSHVGRALNVLGIIEQNKGNIVVAEEIYLRARDYSLAADDKRMLGCVEQNLGILANIRGDLRSAAARYQAGLGCLQEAGDERGCSQVLNNLGMLHVDLHRLDEADQYFERALDICG